MARYFQVLVLTLFQDNYVRLGTIFGLIVGFLSTEIISGDPTNNTFIFGFIGWGIGVYMSFLLSNGGSHLTKKKFKVFQGSR